MNTKFQKLVFATFILAGLFSCQKSESVDSQYESAVATADSTSIQKDEVSYAASQQIPDKKFVKKNNPQICGFYHLSFFKNLSDFISKLKF